MDIIYRENIDLDRDKVLNLYANVGWTAYTDLPDVLMDGIKSSLKTISAWIDNELVGLIRVVGDGKTIIYIQDILVLESYQRYGIGSNLIQKIFEEYGNVRQIILLTVGEEKTVKFYTKNGMGDVAEWGGVAFQKK